jgi:CheY-like chemotaxis protein
MQNQDKDKWRAFCATLRILCVDDDFDNLLVTSGSLEFWGATVHLANSAQEALAMLPNVDINLLVTDLSMPEMDGWHLLKHLIETGQKRWPVIALTAHAMSGDKEQVLAAGFNGYITKPIDLDSVVSDLMLWLEPLMHSPDLSENTSENTADIDKITVAEHTTDKNAPPAI